MSLEDLGLIVYGPFLFAGFVLLLTNLLSKKNYQKIICILEALEDGEKSAESLADLLGGWDSVTTQLIEKMKTEQWINESQSNWLSPDGDRQDIYTVFAITPKGVNVLTYERNKKSNN